MLVGTGSVLRNSPNFIMSVETMLTSTTLRSAVERMSRNKRQNRSLMISRVGIRPRMIRSWLVQVVYNDPGLIQRLLCFGFNLATGNTPLEGHQPRPGKESGSYEIPIEPRIR